MSRSLCCKKVAATSIAFLSTLNQIDTNFGSNNNNTDKKRHSILCDDNDDLASSSPSNKSKQEGAKLLFLGSGSSTGCPKPLCAILFGEGSNFFSQKEKEEKDDKYLQLERLYKNCIISRLATFGDPKENKNYRNNPSLLISHNNTDDFDDNNDQGEMISNTVRNVVIDTGKTFRESAIRFMPSNDITSLDAVVLTHEHMDAVGGMDDLRGFQRTKYLGGGRKHVSMPIYLSDQCYRAVAKMYPYLLPREFSDTDIVRHVAKLDFKRIFSFEPFTAAGLKMTPLPVIHGEDFISNGYAFSLNKTNITSSSPLSESKEDKINVIYLSDLSRIPEKTLDYIRNHTPQPVHILVVDALLTGDKLNPVHYNLNQAIELARCLKAKKTYVVGMNCDDFLPHDEMNEKLRKDLEGDVDIQLAFDGLVIDI